MKERMDKDEGEEDEIKAVRREIAAVYTKGTVNCGNL
jgi:ribosomal protein L29